MDYIFVKPMPLLPIDEPDRSQVLEQLVERTLKRRRIVRSAMGQPLSGIYLEIYEALRSAVKDKLENYTRSVETLSAEIIQEILASCYPKILTHARITQLAIALQNTAPRTAERGYALEQLFAAIYSSKKLISAQTLRVKERFYEDIVQQVLMEWGVQQIQNFDPTRSAFMTWINNQLKWKKSKIMGQLSSVYEISADFLLEGNQESAQAKAAPPLEDFLRDCIEHCSHGDLLSVFEKHMRDRREVTFKRLLKERYVLNKPWKEISQQFGVPNFSSLEHFLHRHLPKILPCLRDCMEDRISLWDSQH